ncbi:MAG TPA: DUF3750 domain-containing protein [Phycisphaerae bacterium]|nr:DUF3750 domain-containing protein [Phycisphaerae bacterium]
MYKGLMAILAFHMIFLLRIVCQAAAVPDQSGYASLDELSGSDQAVVRVYCAPVPYAGPFATHAWFVIKAADDVAFERWELWQDAGGPWGHIRRNLLAPESHVGAGFAYVHAELIGDEAAPIVRFIRESSPTYPCRNHYDILGPNSNTYPQWVLNRTGWRVKLPPSAIGKDAACAADNP